MYYRLVFVDSVVAMAVAVGTNKDNNPASIPNVEVLQIVSSSIFGLY